ncbi:MAG: hypothetical protein QGM50_04170 [Anaerolineae bacterium]|nr:hypothetical protein [Anaerolineae bacterium]MDK1081486.1 hypothetical protein [Anaerolineae bacterium]MDK1117968.1 hypothetical protein [Anaerolineae bacterium]
MLNIAKAVFGGLMLILGREMDWLFSLGIGLLVGLKLNTILALGNPLWMQFLMIGSIGLLAVLPQIVYPEGKYIVTGFLFGGYILTEYGSTVTRGFLDTEFSGSIGLIFFVGAVIGAAVLALLKEWGIMFATALTGAFLIADLFTNLDVLESTLVAGGFFILGAIIQTIIMRAEQAT